MKIGGEIDMGSRAARRLAVSIVIVICAQDFAGSDVHNMSLSAHFAVHRFIRTVSGLKIEALRNIFDDNEALNQGSGVWTAVHE